MPRIPLPDPRHPWSLVADITLDHGPLHTDANLDRRIGRRILDGVVDQIDTIALAKRLLGTGVTVNALHPGNVASGFGMNNGWLMRAAIRVIQCLTAALSPEQGAETQIYLATSPDVVNIAGKYFDKKKPIEPNPVAKDEPIVEHLWKVSEQLTGLAS